MTRKQVELGYIVFEKLMQTLVLSHNIEDLIAEELGDMDIELERDELKVIVEIVVKRMLGLAVEIKDKKDS